jgi:hypothetical protein
MSAMIAKADEARLSGGVKLFVQGITPRKAAETCLKTQKRCFLWKLADILSK